MDASEKSFGAKKYFIYGFKEYITNKNNIQAKRYVPSIREIIEDYIEMYEDRIKDIENIKLKNAEKELIDTINYYIKGSIFYDPKIYKKELELLLDSINNKDENIQQASKAYLICQSLIKKLNKENFYIKIINYVKENSSYENIDIAIQSIVSELLYDGYSLKHLDNWYNWELKTRDISEENINQKLDQFIMLKAKKRDITYYISVKEYSKLVIQLDYNIVLRKVEWAEEDIEEDIKAYLQVAANTTIYRADIKAMDVNKGIEYLIDAFDGYFHMINYLIGDGNHKIEIGEKILACVEGVEYHKIRKKVSDEETIFAHKEGREKQDVEEFIKYRDNVYMEGITYDEVSNIQRALNIAKGQKNQSKENKIIDLWSVLEYILTFHEGKNIISKVKDIVPKVVCLYEIKESINSFWALLYRYKNSGNENVIEFINNCKKHEDDSKYDLKKFIKCVCSEGEQLIDKLQFNDLLKREIARIGTILHDDNYRRKYIDTAYSNVEHDLTKIYRDRNVLIHAGRSNIRNINGKVARLYKYNNSMMGVIIYYKTNNPLLTIQEILSSVEYTYKNYLELLKGKATEEQMEEICRPKYLFLE